MNLKERARQLPVIRDLLALYLWLRESYASVDPRTLGVFRIVLGFLCAADAIRHWWHARFFYSNSGVLTNHYHLWTPSGRYNFSLFHSFSTLSEVHVAFAACVLIHLLFMVGWHTRLFSILSFIIVTSIDNRLVMVENGGYVVVNIVVGYAMFLPTGRRFSVDALLRSYREHKEKTGEDLNRRYRPDDLTAPYVSAIVALAIINLGFVYFFNVVNKSGATWRNGQTVHYVLWLNRMVTGVAVLFRKILPYWATALLTWATMVHEALLVGWVLSPKGKRITRPLAVLGIAALHTTFGVMMRLGPFSWFMIAWGLLLPVRENWEDAGAWIREKVGKRVIVYDRASPLAFHLCRLLARLDALDRFVFTETQRGADNPPLLEVRDGDASLRGKEAFRAILDGLPLGRFLRVPLTVVTLGLLPSLFRHMEAHRDSWASFFGLKKFARGREHVPVNSPARQAGQRSLRFLHELTAAFMIYCAVDQAVRENKCFTPIQAWVNDHYPQPKPVTVALQYPRMFQGWGMFAPNPITDDGVIAVDGYTIDGRRIDPFSGEEPDLVLTDDDGAGLPQIVQDYFNRIRLDKNKQFRDALKQFLINYHKDTGNPNDELVAFDVYWVRDQCPRATEPIHIPVGPIRVGKWTIPRFVLDIPRLSSPPGDGKPYKNEKIAILTYRRPGYRPPPGAPPIPPEPKIESAGN